MSYLILHHDHRLLCYVLVRTILPKPNSTDSLSNKTLELIYILMTSKLVNFARYILSYVAKVSSIMRSTPLPYSNLLTLVFKHFGASLENKICETKPIPIITSSSLNNVQFFKANSGIWKFIEDMTLDEKKFVSLHFAKHVKPRHTSPSTILPPSLPDHTLTLDERVYELQESAGILNYILVQHTNTLDGIAHNEAILNNSLTEMLSSLTEQLTMLKQKVDDLFRLSSVTHHCALKGVPLFATEQVQCANFAIHLIRAASKSSQSNNLSLIHI